MAENMTTLLEKWQKQQQEHPDWTPSPEDLLYFIHGTGSDRDRLFPLSMIYDGSHQIEYITDSGSLTSEQIVNVYKSGRLPVVRMGGGGSGTQTTLYFYPKSIYYKDEGYGSNINRDCLFFAVTYVKESGENFYRTKVQIRRYYNIPVQGYGEQTDEQTVDLTYPDSIKTGMIQLGDGWSTRRIQVPGDQDAFAISKMVDGVPEDVLTVRFSDGLVTVPKKIKFSGGITGPVSVNGKLTVEGNDGLEYTGIGYISGSQKIGPHNFIRLTTGSTYDITGLTVDERVPVYLMNKTGDNLVVSLGDRTVNIPHRYMGIFMKYDNEWYATIGNNV